MDVLVNALTYGMFCGGLGVGLTVIRNIPPKTLRYVFLASFVCGCSFNLVNSLFGIVMTGGILAAFLATSIIRYFFENGSSDLFFRIVITSVYCLCPGTALANFFDGILNMNWEFAMGRIQRVVLMVAGLSIGILLSNLVLDKLYGRKVPEEVR